MLRTFVTAIVLLLSWTHSMAAAQSISEYLILQDIGIYKIDKPEKHLPGEPPSGGPRTYDSMGESGIDHFPDHVDKNYEVMYFGGDANSSPTVQVTQHAGSYSDKWLLHEVDIDFRNFYGIPGKSYAVVPIDGNYVLEFGSAGWDYRWISGNKVIKIDYHDAQMTKPEPLEVVKAYLAKHPSTIPAMTLTQLRSADNKTLWIKDEIDRRLWLCDKWAAHFAAGKTDQKTALEEIIKSMIVFLNYRQKYFNLNADSEKDIIAGYQSVNDSANIAKKLTEYKTWWAAHKTDSITLP